MNHLPVLHRKLPLDTRPIPRLIRWMICPFVSIESRQQLHQHRARSAAPVWGATAAPAPSAHSRSVITGRVQQLHQHRTRTAAPVWGATAAPASPSAHSSSDSIERGQQFRYGAPQQLQHHRARTVAPSEHLGLRKYTCNRL